jgi:parallel beta-helix repeat protein
VTGLAACGGGGEPAETALPEPGALEVTPEAGEPDDSPEIELRGDTLEVEAPDVLPDAGWTTSGEMTSDEVWHGEVLITGDVHVPPGVTLTIEPGTIVRFTAQSDDQSSEEYVPEDPSTRPNAMGSILVFGVIDAQGTPDELIVFTSDSDTPGEMDWQSIQLEGSGAATLAYVVIEHGYFGLQLSSTSVQATITHSQFRDATTCCICAHGPPIDGPIVITDSLFTGCGREAIDTYAGQNITITHNVFASNYVGIMSVGSAVTIENNLFINNGRGIGVVENGTPTISGNAFTGCQGAAIFITDASPIITNNNMYDNLMNLQIEGFGGDVVAENNWWGSADSAAIQESILDGGDDPALGVIDFEPYAMEPFDLDVPEYD